MKKQLVSLAYVLWLVFVAVSCNKDTQHQDLIIPDPEHLSSQLSQDKMYLEVDRAIGKISAMYEQRLHSMSIGEMKRLKTIYENNHDESVREFLQLGRIEEFKQQEKIVNLGLKELIKKYPSLALQHGEMNNVLVKASELSETPGSTISVMGDPINPDPGWGDDGGFGDGGGGSNGHNFPNPDPAKTLAAKLALRKCVAIAAAAYGTALGVCQVNANANPNFNIGQCNDLAAIAFANAELTCWLTYTFADKGK